MAGHLVKHEDNFIFALCVCVCVCVCVRERFYRIIGLLWCIVLLHYRFSNLSGTKD
jgi:hypothetical protein